ncbi:MAG: glycosyltransferase, partial [Bacteroidetes bacterium]|nr:glycosyltransferase [Bacteroidota bacterium]
EITGWVDDIRVAYDEAKIFVAPLMLGSGLQNKLLEAMAMGLPCITTPLANNALGAIPEEEILIANNEAEFKTQIERLLSDANLYDKLATNGHAFVTKNYNWQACNKRLVDVIER